MRQTRSEAKTITHDGAIWPVPRHEMRAADPIRERMAEDLKRLKREAGENPVSLTAAGWTPGQVAAHGHAAKQRLERAERRDKAAADAFSGGFTLRPDGRLATAPHGLCLAAMGAGFLFLGLSAAQITGVL